jgi:hypothetical protein
MIPKSPFPGMDPYLERHWPDVHSRLVTYAGDQLQTQLPSHLRARMEDRVFVEDFDSDAGWFRPDVRIVERGLSSEGNIATAKDVIATEPVVLELMNEPIRQRYVEIIDVKSGGRVVTVIELISPTNKMKGKGNRDYVAKQERMLAGGTSLVEIDLTREGDRWSVMPLGQIPPQMLSTYHAFVRRGWRPNKLEVYPIRLQDRLPIIRIPLRKTDNDVTLDIQALIDQSYANGRYDDLDYRKPLRPLLSEEDAAWVEELLKSAGSC